MYDFFKLIYHIEFFLIPIIAGLLSRAAIKGKKKKPYFMALTCSIIMFILSFIGVYINAPQEIRDSMKTSFEQSMSFAKQ